MMKVRTWFVIGIIVFFGVNVGTGALKPSSQGRQEKEPAVTSTTLLFAPLESDLGRLEARLKKIQELPDVDETTKKWAGETFAIALEALRTADAFAKQKAEHEAAAKAAPQQIEALREGLTSAPQTQDVSIPTTASATQLTAMVSSAEAELAARQKRLQELNEEQKRRAARQTEFPKLIAAARQKIEDAEKLTPPIPPSQPDLSEFTNSLRALVRAAAERELEVLSAEQQMYEATAEQLSLQIEHAQRQLESAEQRLKALREALAVRKQQEAEEAVRLAQRQKIESANAHPLVKAFAEETERLARRRTGPDGSTAKLARSSEAVDQANAQRERLREQFATLKKRLEAAGNSDAIGQLMRRQRDELPDIREIERAIAKTKADISSVQLELLELEGQRLEIPQAEKKLREALATDLKLSPSEVDTAVRELVQTRRTMLAALLSDLNALFSKLVDLQTAETQLYKQVREYAEFLEERIFWVRSTKPIGLTDFRRAGEGIRDLFHPQFWGVLFSATARDLFEAPAYYLLVCLLFVIVWIRHRDGRAIGEQSSHDERRDHRSVLRQFLAAAGSALAGPAVLYLIASRLRVVPTDSEFITVFAVALEKSSIVLAAMQLFAEISAPGCLAQSLLGWSEQTCLAWHRIFRRYTYLFVGIIFFAILTGELTDRVKWDALHRLIFTVLQLVLCWVFWKVFDPHSGPLAGSWQEKPTHWLSRYKTLWQWSSATLPIVLALLALVGYMYTAVELTKRFAESLALCVALYLAVALGERLIGQFSARLVALLTQRGNSGKPPHHEPSDLTGVAEASIHSPDLGVDVHSLSQRVHRLVLAGAIVIVAWGLWEIWRDVAPALSFLDRIVLWQHATQPVPSGDKSSEQTVTTLVMQSVTAADLLIALLIGILTIIASRNIPAVIELVLLQRLRVDSGVRYAFAALARYVLFLIGIVVVARKLGVSWNNVQWLAAAVTVGLGFGLQEIFANFVSGLILLFERPIRVGDLVTIGQTTGTVMQIRTRATTIRDFDGKDLVIPNKQLITGEVVNWTLSDKITRLTFVVGVEYGTEPERVQDVLLQVAKNHPLVLSDPAPAVLFDGFGSWDLRFKLFVHVAALEHRLQTINELNAAIARAFAEAGIMMAFPTYVVNLRDSHGKFGTSAERFLNHDTRGDAS